MKIAKKCRLKLVEDDVISVAALAFGGPASLSGKIHVGDSLVEIDRCSVRGKTEEFIKNRLFFHKGINIFISRHSLNGMDGSFVELGLIPLRSSTLMRVELKRVMLTEPDRIVRKAGINIRSGQINSEDDMFAELGDDADEEVFHSQSSCLTALCRVHCLE